MQIFILCFVSPPALCRHTPTDLGLIFKSGLQSDILPTVCPSLHQPLTEPIWQDREQSQADMWSVCVCAHTRVYEFSCPSPLHREF